MHHQKKNLILRVVLGTVLLIAALLLAFGVDYSGFSLRYPASIPACILIGTAAVLWLVLRIPAILFDKSWVGVIEDVGLKTVIKTGSKGRPRYQQAFFMTIRKENGQTYDYLNTETIASHPGELPPIVKPQINEAIDEKSSAAQKGYTEFVEQSPNRFGVYAPYAKGDVVIHLRGQKYFATWGKEEDAYSICPFCGEIVVSTRKNCYRCGAPVVK